MLSASFKYFLGNDVSTAKHLIPDFLADWIPNGAFSITRTFLGLTLSFLSAFRYGSGCGLPYFTSLPVITTPNSLNILFGKILCNSWREVPVTKDNLNFF